METNRKKNWNNCNSRNDSFLKKTAKTPTRKRAFILLNSLEDLAEEMQESGTPQRVLRNPQSEEVKKGCSPLNIPPSPFMRNLGYGTGVNVYRLERSGQTCSPWAVKRASHRIEQLNQDKYATLNSRIVKEAEILRQLQHPNIIGFRTITKDCNGVDALAMECCNTSLGLILERRFEESEGPLPAIQTKKLIEDIAKALDYLHTEARLLHGDIKSYNVLVKGEFEICKLCDFGVSLPLDETGHVDFTKDSKLEYVGTLLWSAPETFKDGKIGSSCDIFSFGLVIYETIALVPPHTFEVEQNEIEDLNNEENCSNASESNDDTELDESNVSESLENSLSDELIYGTRPPLPGAFDFSDDYNIIIELFYLCTNEVPNDRPNAKEIWQSLQREKETTQSD
ncbi:lymphokine-activated killer T-cell-originated protein kinase [Glossina fuscipes fuscipes]|nr:hypothetical protein GQX74_007849 [Glossina fuscipes]